MYNLEVAIIHSLGAFFPHRLLMTKKAKRKKNCPSSHTHAHTHTHALFANIFLMLFIIFMA